MSPFEWGLAIVLTLLVVAAIIVPIFWMTHGPALRSMLAALPGMLRSIRFPVSRSRGRIEVLQQAYAFGNVAATPDVSHVPEPESVPVMGRVIALDPYRFEQETQSWSRTPLAVIRQAVESPRPKTERPMREVIDAQDLLFEPSHGVEHVPEQGYGHQEPVFVPAVPAVPEPVPVVEEKEHVVVEAPKLRRRDYRFTIGTQNGKPVYFPLGHGIVSRSTRKGKSNIAGIQMAQAIRSGVLVYYLNCSYAPLDEDGLNLSPLINRCADAVIGTDGVSQLLALRNIITMINERADIAIREEVAFWEPVLIIVEELKALTDRLRLFRTRKVEGLLTADEEVSSLLSIILSSGAKYNVNLFVVSQDSQSKSTGISEGSYVNFEYKIYHPSLDAASMRKLLPAHMRGKAQRHPLPVITGPHQWYLTRQGESGVEEITVIDVPLLTNVDIQKYVQGIPERPKPVQRQPEPLADAWSMEQAHVVDAHSQKEEDESAIHPESPAILGASGPTITPVNQMMGWTVEHIRTAHWLAMTPVDTVSNRALARHLWDNDEGRHNVRAGKILAEVRQVVGTLEQVEQESNLESVSS